SSSDPEPVRVLTSSASAVAASGSRHTLACAKTRVPPNSDPPTNPDSSQAISTAPRTSCSPVSGLTGSAVRGVRDRRTHDPAPLGDATVADEAELLEQVLRAGVQVGAALRTTPPQLLGIRLDRATAGPADGAEHGGEPGPGH